MYYSRYKKSEKYKGVYQSKDGTWFYRYKRIFDEGGKPVYYQKGGFLTDKIAYEARMTAIQLGQATSKPKSDREETKFRTFGEYFNDFLENGTDSASSALKYKRLYTAQLKMWENRPVNKVSDADIENLLLGMTIFKEPYIDPTDGKLKFRGYSESYLASFRKCLKQFFKYVHYKYGVVFGNRGQNVDTKPLKLKVLSLFSGIGAPERALENLGIKFEVVKFCELNYNAQEAYRLLHGEDYRKNIWDVNRMDFDYCNERLPDFDIMVFGSPCQDFSKNGKQKGLFNDPETPLPSTLDLFHDDIDDLTRSGLIYRALQVAIWKKPKFMVIENVSALLSSTFEKEFNALLRNMQDIGYNIEFQRLNSRDFGVPQNRPRVFLIAIRDDIAIDFKFPQPVEHTPLAKEWFETDVADEYYLDPKDYKKLDRDTFKPFFSTDCIHCITTKWGNTNKEGKPDPNVQQQLVKDEKGIRCLTSEELMRFQGFRPEDAKILWENGYSRGDIGKLVGNSITVNVMEAIFREFVFALKRQVSYEIIPNKVIKAKIEKPAVEPLFAYMGNKYKLLPYIHYLLPPNLDFASFYDLFAGSATIALNVDADRVVANEKDPFLYYIYKGLSETPPEEAWEKVMQISEKYDLPADCKKCPHCKKKYPKGTPREEKACYPCIVKYETCKEDYNKIPYQERVEKYWYWGLALVYHSFNASHVKHNKKQEFNSPFGNGKCNIPRAKEKFFPVANKFFSKKYEIYNLSYEEFLMKPTMLDDETFFYLDPPYLASTATYRWSKAEEHTLYKFLDDCTERNYRWMLSNVIENNGDTNEILKKWIIDNQYRYFVYFMERDYTQSNFNRKNEGRTIEVVVTNYNASPDNPY